jgi:hypothetical protein
VGVGLLVGNGAVSDDEVSPRATAGVRSVLGAVRAPVVND